MPDQLTATWLQSRYRDYILVLLLFIGGLLLCAALLLPTRFDGLYGQDSYAYYDFAGDMRLALSEGRPLASFFWPLGYPALLAITETTFGAHPQTGQALNLVLGSLLAPLVYILARQMHLASRGALIAGILMAICGQALQSSLVLMSDIPSLFWALLSAIFLSRYILGTDAKTGGRSVFLALAALTLALASVTRWLYLILVFPWGFALLVVWRGRIRWRITVLSLFAAALVLIPQLMYSQMTAEPVLNHAWVEGWSPANAFRQVFDNVDGHFEYAKPNAVFYAEPFYDPYYLAPVFTPFLIIGIAALFRRQRYITGIILLGWIILPYIFLVGIPYQNIRFPLIFFPAVAILVAFGLVYTADWLKTRLAPPRHIFALVGVLSLGLVLTFTTTLPTINTFLSNQTRDKDTADWTQAQIPAGSTLFTFGLTLTLKHETSLNVLDVYYETPRTLASKWTLGKEDYLLLNMWDIKNQWVGREPEIAYNWLRNVRGLVRIDRYQYYTLYKVNG
jgi:4-amino-4-deoxy-L-arabinose transferase-like glycosyltransferase